MNDENLSFVHTNFSECIFFWAFDFLVVRLVCIVCSLAVWMYQQRRDYARDKINGLFIWRAENH